MRKQNEFGKSVSAALATTSAMDKAQVPELHVGRIQASGIAIVRWHLEYVCAAARSLCVLLAALLLVRLAYCQSCVNHLQTCIAGVQKTREGKINGIGT